MFCPRKFISNIINFNFNFDRYINLTKFLSDFSLLRRAEFVDPYSTTHETLLKNAGKNAG